MRIIKILFVLPLAIALAGFEALASGDAPSKSSGEPLPEKAGTSVRGQSTSFEDYLNASSDEDSGSGSLELMDLGPDTKVKADGDEVGLKARY